MKQYFTLKYQDFNTPIVSLSLTLKNYLEKGTLEFNKKDLSTSEPLPNTTIQIYYYKDSVDDAQLIFEGVTDDLFNRKQSTRRIFVK